MLGFNSLDYYAAWSRAHPKLMDHGLEAPIKSRRPKGSEAVMIRSTNPDEPVVDHHPCPRR